MMTLDPANRRGFLIDWDHCVVLRLVNSQPGIRRVLRTVCFIFLIIWTRSSSTILQGTWQFLSARLVDAPHEEHTAVDDRESALHVLMWCALRYLGNNLIPPLLLGKLAVFDECVEVENFSSLGGGGKTNLICGGLRVKFEHDALSDLIDHLCAAFATRYSSQPAIPQNATARKLRRAQDAAEDWEENWANLRQPDWLHKTMRQFAEMLPILEDEKQMDWKDNGVLGKRTLGATEFLNNAKFHDGFGPTTSNSLNPASEVVPESAPKRQRR